MNQEIVSGKWNEFKGELRKRWGDLTENELNQTQGNIKAITGLLQQKYGELKEDAKEGFDNLLKRFGQTASSTTESVKEELRSEKKDTQNTQH